MGATIARVTRLSGDRYEVTANVGPKPYRVIWERTWTLDGDVARSLLANLAGTVKPKED